MGIKLNIGEGNIEIKGPKEPKPSDYYDLRETKEERDERIYLYEGEINE